MTTINLREPDEADWEALLALANASLAGVPNVPPQNEWARNRKSFPTNGIRRHVVAERERAIVGYAAAEHRANAPADGFRLFVVTRPEDRRALSYTLIQWLEAQLDEIGAATAWFIEYAADTAFRSYLESKGYPETRRIVLPDGNEAVIMSRAAPFARA